MAKIERGLNSTVLGDQETYKQRFTVRTREIEAKLGVMSVSGKHNSGEVAAQDSSSILSSFSSQLYTSAKGRETYITYTVAARSFSKIKGKILLLTKRQSIHKLSGLPYSLP